MWTKKLYSFGISSILGQMDKTQSVGNIFFYGYEDPIINLGKSLPFVKSRVPPMDKFAWFYKVIYFSQIDFHLILTWSMLVFIFFIILFLHSVRLISFYWSFISITFLGLFHTFLDYTAKIFSPLSWKQGSYNFKGIWSPSFDILRYFFEKNPNLL